MPASAFALRARHAPALLPGTGALGRRSAGTGRADARSAVSTEGFVHLSESRVANAGRHRGTSHRRTRTGLVQPRRIRTSCADQSYPVRRSMRRSCPIRRSDRDRSPPRRSPSAYRPPGVELGPIRAAEHLDALLRRLVPKEMEARAGLFPRSTTHRWTGPSE